MIVAQSHGPQPSWTNTHPTIWDTGFQRVTHVPPSAIGPQMRGAPIQFQGAGVDLKTVLMVGVLAAAGVGAAYFALRIGKRRRRRR